MMKERGKWREWNREQGVMCVWIVRRIITEVNEGCGSFFRSFEIFDMRYPACSCIAITLAVRTANQKHI